MDLGGSPRHEKPAKIKPVKGGFRNFVSLEIGGAFKGRERAYAYTLNNTEWGGGGAGARRWCRHLGRPPDTEP